MSNLDSMRLSLIKHLNKIMPIVHRDVISRNTSIDG